MQVAKQKLLFLHHLIKMDSKSLAKEILQNLLGLVDECQQLIKLLDLPDILDCSISHGVSKMSWKRLVKGAICLYEEKELKSEISRKSKLVDGPMVNESFERQEYISRLSLQKSRNQFKIRSKMLDVKFNYSAKYEHELWRCDSCCSAIETQTHILYCPAYLNLRSGKDLKSDKDLLDYIKKVMEIRISLKLNK